jgi:ammonia channel protein AmtB
MVLTLIYINSLYILTLIYILTLYIILTLFHSFSLLKSLGPTDPRSVGVIYGGNGFLIGTQLAGVCVGVIWSASGTTLIMLFLRLLEKVKKVPLQLAVSPFEEEIGLDMAQIVWITKE